MSTISLPEQMKHADAQACLALVTTALKGASERALCVVDASAVARFDSSAIAVLLEARRQAQAGGQQLQVQNWPPALRRLAQVYGVAELFEHA